MLRQPLTTNGLATDAKGATVETENSKLKTFPPSRTSQPSRDHPVPELPETIDAQLLWLVEGKRAAVLLTPGAAVPELMPIGIQLLSTPLGIFVYNPELVNERLILRAIRDDEVGLLLGYGVPRKPKQDIGCVTLRGKNGHEKQSVVVDGDTMEQAIRKANELAEAGDRVVVESCEHGIKERLGNVLKNFCELRPIKDAADMKRLELAAAEDNHNTWMPSHLIEKNGETVGYVGLNSVPMFRVWFHSKKVRPIETCHLVNLIENTFRAAGHKFVVTGIHRDSPFMGVAGKFGYKGIETLTLHVKAL